MKQDKNNQPEVGEDTGEFVPTRFAWISLKKQKENAKRLQNITKKGKQKIRIYKNPYFLLEIVIIKMVQYIC